VVSPDPAQTHVLLDAVFRYVENGYLALRVFHQSRGDLPALVCEDIAIDDTAAVVDAITRLIGFAATSAEPSVFAPPMAVFSRSGTARTEDVAEAPTLIVELDAGDTTAAITRLEHIIGPATVIVRSGSTWTDPASGTTHPKRHAYWRLSEPTRTRDDHNRLYVARRDAALLIGADTTGAPVVHCYRWPGSLNRKDPVNPTLCTIERITPDAEIDLADAAERLADALEAAGIPATERAQGDNSGANGASNPALRADPARVASAVACIPNDDVPYPLWVDMLIAIAGATGEEGYAIARVWSAKSAKHREKETRATWRRIVKAGVQRRGAGTVFYIAAQHGWQRPDTGWPGAEVDAPTGPVAAPGAGLEATGAGGDDDDEIELPPDFSENALALVFTARHAGDLGFVHEWGRWLRWEDGRWCEDHAVRVFDRARRICAEAGRAAIATLNKSGHKVAAAINKASCVAAIERLTRHHHRHVRAGAAFDAAARTLNAPISANKLPSKHPREDGS
jgi:hypothetical protein